MKKGVFISFEGVDGCGKSTQIALLNQYLTRCGHTVVQTREPGGTPIAEAIRDLLLDPANRALCPEAELLLYEASRAQHVQEKIMPAVEAGHIVLSDRFADSTVAYQGAGRGFAPEIVATLHALVVGDFWPDVTILIDLPVEIGMARLQSRTEGLTRLEEEAMEFHNRVRQAFLCLADQEPDRIKVVDGRQTIDEIAGCIARHVDAIINSL